MLAGVLAIRPWNCPFSFCLWLLGPRCSALRSCPGVRIVDPERKKKALASGGRGYHFLVVAVKGIRLRMRGIPPYPRSFSKSRFTGITRLCRHATRGEMLQRLGSV